MTQALYAHMSNKTIKKKKRILKKNPAWEVLKPDLQIY
jgi:hypothetical protein